MEKNKTAFVLPADEDILQSLATATTKYMLKNYFEGKGKNYRNCTESFHLSVNTSQSNKEVIKPEENAKSTEYKLKKRTPNPDTAKLSQYITCQREVFHIQHQIGLKRDEMARLEALLEDEKNGLEDQEKKLEYDAETFDAFLKDSDTKAVQLGERAEKEYQNRKQVEMEYQQLNSEALSLHSELQQLNQQLKELSTYKQFITQVISADHLNNVKEANQEGIKIIIDVIKEQEKNSVALIQQRLEAENEKEKIKEECSAIEIKTQKEFEALELQIKEVMDSLQQEETKALQIKTDAEAMLENEDVSEKELKNIGRQLEGVYQRLFVGRGNEKQLAEGLLERPAHITALLESQALYFLADLEALPLNVLKKTKKIYNRQLRQEEDERREQEIKVKRDERAVKAKERKEKAAQKKFQKYIAPAPQKKRHHHKEKLKQVEPEQESNAYFFA